MVRLSNETLLNSLTVTFRRRGNQDKTSLSRIKFLREVAVLNKEERIQK